MPELGKATYYLEMNTADAQVGLERIEAQTVQTTGVIDSEMSAASASVERLGVAHGQAASAVTAADTRMAAANRKTAESATLLGKRSEEAGKKTMKWALGLGAITAYLGIQELKEETHGIQLLTNAIETTSQVAGVSVEHGKELAETWRQLAGVSEGTTYQIEQMLLRFTNIRNVGPGVNAVFDRAVTAIQNVSTVTGKSATAISVAVGKALQDPAKYIAMLGRSGITFNKNQVKQIQLLAASGRGYEAQLMILEAIEHRYGGLTKSANMYGGAALAAAQTPQGKFHIAVEQMKEASKVIVVEFIPAFMALVKVITGVAKVLSKHAQLVKYIVIMTLAWKSALILGGVWGRAAKGIAVLAAATRGAAAAETAAASNAAGLRAATLLLGSPAVIGAVLALVGAYKMLNDMKNAVKGQEKAEDQLGTDRYQELAFYSQRYKLWRARGVSEVKARERANKETAAMAKRTGLAEWQGSSTFGVPGGAVQKPTDFSDVTHHTKKKDPKKRGSVTLARLMAGPEFMAAEIALARSEADKNVKAANAALRTEDQLLRGLAGKVKKGSQDELAVWQQIGMVDAQIEAIAKKHKKKQIWHLPNRYGVMISKAEQTAMLKDDIKAYDAERVYLENLLKGLKVNSDKYAKIQKELARVDQKLRALRKEELKRKKAAADATRKELQAARDLRGTFFGQFASSVFHQTVGGLALGAGSGTTGGTGSAVGGGDVHVKQENHYHEIPKDKHKEARRMRRATESAMA